MSVGDNDKNCANRRPAIVMAEDTQWRTGTVSNRLLFGHPDSPCRDNHFNKESTATEVMNKLNIQSTVIKLKIAKTILVPVPTFRDISQYLAKIYSPIISPIVGIMYFLLLERSCSQTPASHGTTPL